MTNTPPAPGNKDALEALENLVIAVSMGWDLDGVIEVVKSTGGTETIRTALSNTYDPATHILVAREDVPEGLERVLRTHFANDTPVGGRVNYTVGYSEMCDLLEAAALLAQKTEEYYG